YRRQMKSGKLTKYAYKVNRRNVLQNRPEDELLGDPTNDIFYTKPPEEAKGREKRLFFRKKT
ncbi:hypothetical protein SK128_000702, partial [Halocaridina rubra]